MIEEALAKQWKLCPDAGHSTCQREAALQDENTLVQVAAVSFCLAGCRSIISYCTLDFFLGKVSTGILAFKFVYVTLVHSNTNPGYFVSCLQRAEPHRWVFVSHTDPLSQHLPQSNLNPRNTLAR